MSLFRVYLRCDCRKQKSPIDYFLLLMADCEKRHRQKRVIVAVYVRCDCRKQKRRVSDRFFFIAHGRRRGTASAETGHSCRYCGGGEPLAWSIYAHRLRHWPQLVLSFVRCALLLFVGFGVIEVVAVVSIEVVRLSI